jgi:hypothetical protein
MIPIKIVVYRHTWTSFGWEFLARVTFSSGRTECRWYVTKEITQDIFHYVR